MTMIKLQSSDEIIFEMELKAARQSGTLEGMIATLGSNEVNKEPVPLPNVNAATLQKIIEWATHHKDDPELSEEEKEDRKRRRYITEWDTEFFNVPQGVVLELLVAADYLDMKALVSSGTLIMANMIRGKKPEEIREFFKPPGQDADMADEWD